MLAILAMLYFSVLKGPTDLLLPLLLLIVWLVYALIRTRSLVGIVLTVDILALIVISVIWISRNSDLVKSYYIKRYENTLLSRTNGAGWQEKKVGTFQLRYREHDLSVVKVVLALEGTQKRVTDFFSVLQTSRQN